LLISSIVRTSAVPKPFLMVNKTERVPDGNINSTPRSPEDKSELLAAIRTTSTLSLLVSTMALLMLVQGAGIAGHSCLIQG